MNQKTRVLLGLVVGLCAAGPTLGASTAGIIYNNTAGSGQRDDIGSYGNSFSVTQNLFVNTLGTQDNSAGGLAGTATTGTAFSNNGFYVATSGQTGGFTTGSTGDATSYQTAIWAGTTLLGVATIKSTDSERLGYVYDTSITVSSQSVIGSNGFNVGGQLELIPGITYIIGTAAFDATAGAPNRSGNAAGVNPTGLPWRIGNYNSTTPPTAPTVYSYTAGTGVTLLGTSFNNNYTTTATLLEPSGANNNGTGGWGPANFEASTTAAPEPASLCLLAVGGLGLLARRRRV